MEQLESPPEVRFSWIGGNEGGFTNLKRLFNTLERRGNGIIEVLLGDPRERLETSSRKPFRDIFDCGSELCEVFCEGLL